MKCRADLDCPNGAKAADHDVTYASMIVFPSKVQEEIHLIGIPLEKPNEKTIYQDGEIREET